MLKNRLITSIIVNLVFLNLLFSQSIEIPVIDNVTVDLTTQEVTLSWHVNNPALVNGYIIKRQIFGQTDVVDGSYNTVVNINDQNQTTYIDIGIDYGTAEPKLGVENYRIAAFKDNAGIIEYGNMSDIASTIYLYPVSFDLCIEQNTLTWSSHDDFGANFGGYRIYYKNNLDDIAILLT